MGKVEENSQPPSKSDHEGKSEGNGEENRLLPHSTGNASENPAPLSCPPASSESPSELLKRSLSVRSVVSTSSNFAKRMNSAEIADGSWEYRIIGVGSCGTIFEIPGLESALKKGKDTEALWKDFVLTNKVHNAIADTREFLQDAFPDRAFPKAPRCRDFYLPDSKDFWDTALDKFPQSHRISGAVFQVDRILPLPKPVREALSSLYFDEDESVQEEAKINDENGDCLVRLYLGEN